MAMAEDETRRSATPTDETPALSPGVGARGGRTSRGTRKKKLPMTVPKPFNLGLEQRVEERRQYQEELHERQLAAEEREKELQKEREKEEKEALREYRKSLVIKANPIRKYTSITLSPSSKELTVPRSPELSSVNRRRNPSSGLPSDGGSSSHEDISITSREDSASREDPASPDEHFGRVL